VCACFVWYSLSWSCVCFFFQGEDGIRDFHVTGVQTCALPIWFGLTRFRTPRVEGRTLSPNRTGCDGLPGQPCGGIVGAQAQAIRSEERRVGREGRTWWLPL